jgi:hypothetical protein
VSTRLRPRLGSARGWAYIPMAAGAAGAGIAALAGGGPAGVFVAAAVPYAAAALLLAPFTTGHWQAMARLEGESSRRAPARTRAGPPVFVAHGHDGGAKYEVAEFLELVTGQRPVIFHEQPDAGRTVIEKFEALAEGIRFAVVLLTGDDVGALKGGEVSARARQNVILELGYFLDRLGRGRVTALYEPGVELPSDLPGALYTPLTGNWHTELARELQAAGLNADLGRLARQRHDDAAASPADPGPAAPGARPGSSQARPVRRCPWLAAPYRSPPRTRPVPRTGLPSDPARRRTIQRSSRRVPPGPHQ